MNSVWYIINFHFFLYLGKCLELTIEFSVITTGFPLNTCVKYYFMLITHHLCIPFLSSKYFSFTTVLDNTEDHFNLFTFFKIFTNKKKLRWELNGEKYREYRLYHSSHKT